MKRFNGLAVAKEGQSWKALRSMYPHKKVREVEAKIIDGLERIAKKLGTEFDEDVYTCTLTQVAEYLEMDYSFFLLLCLGRWSKATEIKLADLVIIGTGECENCGCDELEFKDHGAFWKTPDIYECGFCKHEQFQRGD